MNDLPFEKSSTPAPEELIERAWALVKGHPECFWFWHPEARVYDLDCVRLVVKQLRQYGDHESWRDAQDLHRCLSQTSRGAF